MSKVKRILAVLVATIMTLGMTVSAFAAPTAASSDGKFGTSGDKGEITVNGIDKETGPKFAVEYYRVIEAQYGNNGSFSGYTSLYTDAIPNPIPENFNITESQLNKLAKDVENKTADGTMEYKEATGSYVANVTPGTYLVMVKGTETKSYNPMVVSLYYERKTDGTTGLKEDTLTLTEGVANAKKSGTPEVNKKIVDDSTARGSTDKGNTAEIGKDVSYEVSINPVPSYNGSYPVLKVVDTLSTGLTFKDLDSLHVYVKDGTTEKELTSGFTKDVEGQVITVDFASGYNYSLNDYAGKEIVIRYQATVNEQAALNDAGNNNNVVLSYTKDSKTNGSDETKEDKTYTYTFDIDGEATGTTGIITKTGDRTEDTDGLNGATFGLYKNEADAQNGGKADQTAESITIGGKKGQLHFTGLEAGRTYYLRETAAPTGYSVNTHIFKVLITATYDKTAGSDTYGQLTSWTVSVDGTAVASFSANSEGTWQKGITGADILNTKISSLPSTGGIGTTIFTIGGCAIMIVAAGLFFATRRKTQK